MRDQDARRLLRARVLAILVFVVASVLFLVLGQQLLGLSGWRLYVTTLGLAATLSSLTFFFSHTMVEGAAAGASLVYMGGATTPYEEQFSQMQALVMQEKYAEALELFEHQIGHSPGEPRVRIACADLYVKHGNNPKRAAELYREVQRIPRIQSGHDIYATNKLADLYLGSLKEPGRALVEFRKLAARYPNSVAARNAELAIANLKPQIVPGAEGSSEPDIWEPPPINRDGSPPADTPGMPGY